MWQLIIGGILGIGLKNYMTSAKELAKSVNYKY